MNRSPKSLRDQECLRKVAILGNDLPRQCGLATFTSHLFSALESQEPDARFDLIVMNDREGYEYSDRVSHQINAQNRLDYARASEFINNGIYDILSVQHEYGIFGGKDGEYLISLLQKVNVPIVTTLHTVLRNPSKNQKAILLDLLALSQRVVVMSVMAVKILEDVYGIPVEKVDLIPHGIPDVDMKSPSNIKNQLGIDGSMIFTFGLLSPDKGIEYAIQAMPKVLEADKDAVYVVLGATHPGVVASEGEKYRESLVRLTIELGVEKSVLFVDRFASEPELVEFLSAADIYITPYLNAGQITSGTLAYALGAGKAVISTPYIYAQELLAGGRGTLVEFKNPDQIAEAILKLRHGRGGSSLNPFQDGESCRPLQWSEVAKLYIASFLAARNDYRWNLSPVKFEHFSAPTDNKPMHFRVPKLSTAHLENMSDATGLFQHAIYSIPDLAHGYCVDDNARALLLTTLLEDHSMLSVACNRLQRTYLKFVQESFNRENGRFRNFMGSDGRWLEPQGSNDSHGRTLWSLGTAYRRTRSPEVRNISLEYFHLGSPAIDEMDSPRTWAFAILGADEILAAKDADVSVENLLRTCSERLWQEYRMCSKPDWCWFEEIVTYENARLCQALILAGHRLGIREMLEDGLESLRWLMGHQVRMEGCFQPIGSNGFWPRRGGRAEFDQQPVEAWGCYSACTMAAEITGFSSWIFLAERAFEWFLGRNDLGLSLYDETTGGCRDGIHPDRLNENQGAESVISFLCTLAEKVSSKITSQAHPKRSML